MGTSVAIVNMPRVNRIDCRIRWDPSNLAVDGFEVDREIIEEFESGIISINASSVDTDMAVVSDGNGFIAQCDQAFDVKNFGCIHVTGDGHALGAEDTNVSTAWPSKIKSDAVDK